MSKSGRSEDSWNNQKQYGKNNLQQIKFALNKNTDAELIEWLNGKKIEKPGTTGGIAGYLKDLIKADMEKQRK